MRGESPDFSPIKSAVGATKRTVNRGVHATRNGAVKSWKAMNNLAAWSIDRTTDLYHALRPHADKAADIIEAAEKKTKTVAKRTAVKTVKVTKKVAKKTKTVAKTGAKKVKKAFKKIF